MINISRNFVCTNNSRKIAARMKEMKRLQWSVPKSHRRLLRIKWNKTTFQIHIFFTSICRGCEKKEKEKPCRRSQGLSNSRYCKLEQEFHVFCQQVAKRYLLKKKKCYHLRAAIDVLMVFFVFRGTYPSLSN